MATTPTPPPATDPNLPPVRQQPPAEDPEVARLKGEVARNRQELDQLRSRVSAPPAPAANNQPMSAADMAREFYKDPVGNVVAIANKIAEDRMRAEGEPSRQTMIQVAKDTVRNRSDADRKLFDKYYLEIQAAVDTVAPQFHGNINVWENAFKMVKGNHIDEIIAERQTPPPTQSQAPAAHIREGGGPESPSPRAAGASGANELSVDEKRAAKKLGLTEEQYKQGKAHIDGQNDPVRDPVGPSSWDKYITFDSRERRRRLRDEAAARRK